MAILGSNYDMMQTPTQWGQYIPDPMDYRTTPEYQAAMDAYNQAYAQTPAGQPAGQAPGYDEASGMHYAGSQRMADMTAGQYQADLLNHRMMQAAAGGPDSANYKQFLLAMNSRAGVRPDESGLAYNAMNPDGSQILNPALAALLERLGIGPAAVPGFEGGANGLPPQSLGPKTAAPTTGVNTATPGTGMDPRKLGEMYPSTVGATTEIDNRRDRPGSGFGGTTGSDAKTPSSGSTPKAAGASPQMWHQQPPVDWEALQGGFRLMDDAAVADAMRTALDWSKGHHQPSFDYERDARPMPMGNSLGGGFVGPQQGGGGGFSLPGAGVPPEQFAMFIERLKQQMGGGMQQPMLRRQDFTQDQIYPLGVGVNEQYPPMNSAQPNPASYGYTF